MNNAVAAFGGLIHSLKIQAAVCGQMGSPFSQAMLDAAARDVEDHGPTRDLMARWAETSTRAAMIDAVPLRLLGALHDLALSGDDGALTAAYPGGGFGGDPAAAWSAALKAMAASPEGLARFMDHEPQTNEVRRSACLLAGFLQVAADTRLPIHQFEIGASAGLNQLWDRYAYRFGQVASWGSSSCAVIIPTDWRGPPPPLSAVVRVTERAACDRRPVDLDDPSARRRLRAYVWADQFDRLERLDAAVAMARDAGTRVEAEDAVTWTKQRVSVRPGAVTVLFHSVFWQYMPPESQARLDAIIRCVGAAATTDAPFAWLRMEPASDDLATMELRQTLWPDGTDRRLATVHPHGAWVAWDA